MDVSIEQNRRGGKYGNETQPVTTAGCGRVTAVVGHRVATIAVDI